MALLRSTSSFQGLIQITKHHRSYKINRNLNLNVIFSDSFRIFLAPATHSWTSHVTFGVFNVIKISFIYRNYQKKHCFEVEIKIFGTLAHQIPNII